MHVINMREAAFCDCVCDQRVQTLAQYIMFARRGVWAGWWFGILVNPVSTNNRPWASAFPNVWVPLMGNTSGGSFRESKFMFRIVSAVSLTHQYMLSSDETCICKSVCCLLPIDWHCHHHHRSRWRCRCCGAAAVELLRFYRAASRPHHCPNMTPRLSTSQWMGRLLHVLLFLVCRCSSHLPRLDFPNTPTIVIHRPPHPPNGVSAYSIYVARQTFLLCSPKHHLCCNTPSSQQVLVEMRLAS
jgi:hypothetical protein